MMKHNDWKMVKLGEVLKLANNTVLVKPFEKYKLLGMRLEGRGLFIREEKLGSEISSKSINKLVSNQFIYSRLFAWKGAFDYVKSEFEECYCSDEFPAFSLDDASIDIKYLNYFFNQSRVWQEVERFCAGVTKASRNRFKEKFLLDMEIPLPHLPEQQRIVAHLTALQNKIEAIKRLRSEQEKTVKNLLYSLFVKTIEKAEWVKMGEVAPIIRRDVSISENGVYPELGIRSFGKGTFHKPALKGLEVGTKRLYQIETGDLLFSNVFAWEGAIAVAQAQDHGRFGSHRFISCLCNAEKILPEFLCFYFLTEAGMEKINKASPGGAGRNKTLGLTKLQQIEVPIPSIGQQRAFILTQAKLQAAKQLQTTQLEALNGLLPSVLDKAFRGEL